MKKLLFIALCTVTTHLASYTTVTFINQTGYEVHLGFYAPNRGSYTESPCGSSNHYSISDPYLLSNLVTISLHETKMVNVNQLVLEALKKLPLMRNAQLFGTTLRAHQKCGELAYGIDASRYYAWYTTGKQKLEQMQPATLAEPMTTEIVPLSSARPTDQIQKLQPKTLYETGILEGNFRNGQIVVLSPAKTLSYQ